MIELEYWGAVWCGPCRSMSPILNELKADGYNITKMDADDNVTLAQQNRIAGIPTIIFRKNGSEVGRLVGARDKRTILAHIQKYS